MVQLCGKTQCIFLSKRAWIAIVHRQTVRSLTSVGMIWLNLDGESYTYSFSTDDGLDSFQSQTCSTIILKGKIGYASAGLDDQEIPSSVEMY